MVFLTRLDGKEMVVNDDHILYLEATPDTVITLTTGSHLMVKEPVIEVVSRVAAFRRQVFQGPILGSPPAPTPSEPPPPEPERPLPGTEG